MSDFDDVLERLLTDPGFQARLAADPAGALAGYQLDADELELLQAQVGGGDAGQSRVEQRTSKASMFGLFSSIGSGIGDVVHGHGGHGLGDTGGQGTGPGQSAARGLGALEQSGSRHAAIEPDPQPGGLAGHVPGAVEHGAHASAGGVEAHAGPGGAYASAGFTEAQSGGHGGAGLAEADPDAGQGNAGLAEAQDGGPRTYASAGYGGGEGSAGLAEAPDPQAYGGAGLAEADPYAAHGHGVTGHVTEAHSSSQGTVYRSSSAGTAGFGQAGGSAGLGQADGGAGSGRHGIGRALDGLQAAHGGSPVVPPPGAEGGHRGLAGGVADALHDAGGGTGQAPTDGYHTRVDWDGDGKWDQHTYVNRADGGVDIVVDADGDGRADFVGHDTDRDGLINSSELDTNHDGVMDQRYEDLNGDGWLDRRTR